MGVRYYLSVKCPNCKFEEEDVYYAPTCGFMNWECPSCRKTIDLEEYSGIVAEGCATTGYGVKAIREFKESRDKDEIEKWFEDLEGCAMESNSKTILWDMESWNKFKQRLLSKMKKEQDKK